MSTSVLFWQLFFTSWYFLQALNLALAAFSLIFLCLRLEYVHHIETFSSEECKEDINVVVIQPASNSRLWSQVSMMVAEIIPSPWWGSIKPNWIKLLFFFFFAEKSHCTQRVYLETFALLRFSYFPKVLKNDICFLLFFQVTVISGCWGRNGLTLLQYYSSIFNQFQSPFITFILFVFIFLTDPSRICKAVQRMGNT